MVQGESYLIPCKCQATAITHPLPAPTDQPGRPSPWNQIRRRPLAMARTHTRPFVGVRHPIMHDVHRAQCPFKGKTTVRRRTKKWGFVIYAYCTVLWFTVQSIPQPPEAEKIVSNLTLTSRGKKPQNVLKSFLTSERELRLATSLGGVKKKQIGHI